ncbi:hypothetical protein A2476_01030, partial [candidate division CPR3 bacterium RIFOXYC2_FULL_35_7]
MTEKPVALLLAGGKSTRFWPLSEKNTYTYLGKNLVERHIETLKRLGFRDLIVVSSDKVFDWLVSNSERFSDFNINYVKQKEGINGMAGAVLSAVENYRTHFNGRSLYILNCNDIYDDVVHENMMEKFENRADVDVFVAGYEIKKYLPLGYFIFESGKIVGIKEKPGEDKMPSNLANLVAHLFRNPEKFLLKIEKIAKDKSNKDDIYEVALDLLFKEQGAEVVAYNGRWEILKYPWHVLSVMDYFLSEIRNTLIDPSAEVSDKAIISDKVIIAEGVKIMEGAKIVGPCYIGKNTVIGNNTMVRDSMVGENCVIGFGSEVTRSYLGDEIWLHTNYIGDSILEENISLGSGAVTGNLRLDEQSIFVTVKEEKINSNRNKLGMIVGTDVRFGVNSAIMPGVKI